MHVDLRMQQRGFGSCGFVRSLAAPAIDLRVVIRPPARSVAEVMRG